MAVTPALKAAANRGTLLVFILLAQDCTKAAAGNINHGLQGRSLKTSGTTASTNQPPPSTADQPTPSAGNRPSPSPAEARPAWPTPPTSHAPGLSSPYPPYSVEYLKPPPRIAVPPPALSPHSSPGGSVPRSPPHKHPPPSHRSMPSSHPHNHPPPSHLSPRSKYPPPAPGPAPGPVCTDVTCSAAWKNLEATIDLAVNSARSQFNTKEAWLLARDNADTAAANALNGISSAAGEGLVAMDRMATSALALAPSLSYLGRAVALSVPVVYSPNASTIPLTAALTRLTAMSAQALFQPSNSDILDIATQLTDINTQLQGNNTLNAYLLDRQCLIDINGTLNASLQAPTTDNFRQLTSICQTATRIPQAWLDQYVVDLSENGNCSSSGFECLFDAKAGIANLIGYDRFTFLSFVALFYNDAALAVNLAVVCEAVTNVTVNFASLNATAVSATAKYTTLVNNVEAYYSGSLATDFWATQFGQDVDSQMSLPKDNNATAFGLWGLLSSKYDQLHWGVAVWDGVTGSDQQGVLYNACDVQPPPSSCTLTGGSYHSFRYPTGSKASYMIFFLPSSIASLQPQFAAVDYYATQCANVAPDSLNPQNWTVGSMVDQVLCISECNNGVVKCETSGPTPVHAALAVRFGNGLRAKYDGDGIYFRNAQTYANCAIYEQYGQKCPTDLPMISIMALPASPS